MPESAERPVLIGYLPPMGGIRKTAENYTSHRSLVNIGDIAYTYAGTLLTAGRNFRAWNFSMPAEQVNEQFSKVIFFIPCRIAPPPHDEDGYPYEQVTQFVEGLRIPFFSLSESIQCASYDYSHSLHSDLAPKVVRYLHTLADRSPVLGTRGEYSAEVLSALGIRNARPLGCPSLYLNGPQLHARLSHPPSLEAVERVAVCYSNYQHNDHSRIGDVLRMAAENGYEYVEQSFGLASKALYYPGKIEPIDVYAAKRIYQDLGPLLRLFAHGRLHYFTNYQLWKSFLASMDFAFGARMHGLTPAVQAGVPSLFIAHDARVREMCEFFGLPFIPERDLPPEIRLEDLLKACDYSTARARYPVRYAEFLSTLADVGLAPNTNSDGSIADSWEPTPDQIVEQEETSTPGSAQAAFFQQLLMLADSIPDQHFETLHAMARLSREWYRSTHPLMG